MDVIELQYFEGTVFKIKHVNIDSLSRFEIIGLVKNIGFTNMEEFYYLIPGMSLREGLRTCHCDFQSLDVVATTAI